MSPSRPKLNSPSYPNALTKLNTNIPRHTKLYISEQFKTHCSIPYRYALECNIHRLPPTVLKMMSSIFLTRIIQIENAHFPFKYFIPSAVLAEP